jgi:hypothetical protein
MDEIVREISLGMKLVLILGIFNTVFNQKSK